MGKSGDSGPAFLQGGGEMGACMRSFAWHDTPLGVPASWPQSLKTAVSLLLRARQPMFIGWGPQLVSLYNDGYIPICGDKHPHALGRPMAQVWSEIWDTLSVLNDAVLRGEAQWHENMPFDLAGRGGDGPSYFSFSYTPLLDDDGAIGGIFCSAVETTAVVRMAQRRADEMRRQQRMFEQAPGFICTLSGPEHRFEFVNDAHRRLFQRGDIVGKTIREAFPDIVGQGFHERLDDVYRTGMRHVSHGLRTRLRDTPTSPEREVLLDFVYAPVFDDNGRVTGIFCEGHDVTAVDAAQEALLEKEEQLRLATEAAEVGFWDLNLVPGTLYWPPRVRRMFGITGDEPVTLADFYAGLHPEDLEATSAAFAAACDPARRALYDVEYRTVGREDGLVRWVAAKGRGMFDADGRCVRVLGTAIDISARKASEQAMEVALAASRTGTFHWDIQNNKLDWDSALDRLFGLRPGEVVRSLDQFVALVHPDDRAGVIARCERCRDEAADFEMEFRVVYPDGSVHWLYDRGRTFVDAAGKAKTMTGACVDVTQRREAEAALRASEQERQRELRTLADNSPDVIARFDRELRHVFINAAVERFTGLAPELFLGRTNEELGMPGALCEQWNRSLRKVFDEGRPLSTQFELDDGGTQRHFSARLVPEPDDDGVVRHVLGVTREISDLWQAQEALRRADRQKDDFLATLAHELRNPLAPLRTGLHILKRSAAPPEEQRVRQIMERQLNHMVRLVDELLDIARISRGKIVLSRETLQLDTVLQHAVDACRPLLDAQGHQLSWEGVDRRWHVHGDITRLVQVVGNLLNNAAKYTPPGGHVSLRAVEDGEGVAVIVEDDGIGIPRDLLDRVFERFVQVDQHLERAQGGLGIGLSVVKSLAEMHGGRVRAESPGPGAGSRFSVWLPRAQSPHADTDADSQAIAPIAVQRRKVLIVDDNRDAAETLSMVVAQGGHEVHLAHDGASALRIAAAQHPAVVFLDIGMPGMNGYETAGRLRALPGANRPVLVALTGWGSEEDRARSLAAGFDVHLTKPVDLGEVQRMLSLAERQPGAVA